MMVDVTRFGEGTTVRGRISGLINIEVLGFLEGDVAIGGELLIERKALVAANLSARNVVVHGAVRGDVTAEESITLEEGARVVGDVRAPRLSIAPGARVRGYVQTGSSGEAALPARAHVPAVRPAPIARPHHVEAMAKRPAATPARPARPAERPIPMRAPSPPASKRKAAEVSERRHATSHSGPHAHGKPASPAHPPKKPPPPPVIPAVRKGKGTFAKKKSG